MKYQYVKPGILEEYVRTVLIVDKNLPEGSDSLPIFTNGMPALICTTESSKEGFDTVLQLALYGKAPANICEISKQGTTIAYFFHPFAIAPMFNIEVSKLSESPLELSCWNPHLYTALNMQLTYAEGTLGKIDVINNLLVQQFSENQQICKTVQYATDRILNNSKKEIIGEILKELELTERTLQRIFKKYVGVTPTHYRRICQFQLSFGQLRESRFTKTSEVAYDNNFADQSHFIRTFKEFTLIKPNDYLKTGLKNKK